MGGSWESDVMCWEIWGLFSRLLLGDPGDHERITSTCHFWQVMVGLEVHLVSFEESDIYLKPNIHITYHTVADLPSKSFHHDEPYLQSHIARLFLDL